MIFKCYLSTHCMLTYLFCPLSKPVNPEMSETKETGFHLSGEQGESNANPEVFAGAKVVQTLTTHKAFNTFYDF